jgi:putative selenium metabolism hydrolase
MSTETRNTIAQQISAAASDLAERQARFLADLIAIRSYTGDEALAVERSCQELHTVGCDEVWIDSAGNALGRIGDGRQIILYDAHLDTNEVADASEWPHPPLQATIKDGAMWGLGASDCKGGVATIVYAGAILKQLALSGDFTLLLMASTLEEDAEGFAMRALVERDGLRPDVVLLAEATDLTLRRGQRGRCEIRVRVTGKAAHASRPDLGDNAILKMLPIISLLTDMGAALPVDPVFGQGTQVVSMIAGPHTPNSVPSWCEITLDRRLVPGETMQSVLRDIRAVAEPLGATVTVPDQRVTTHNGTHLDGPSFFPGWLLPEEHPLLEAGRVTGEALWGTPPAGGVWQFSTNGAYWAGIAAIPTMGMGAQEEKYVHAVDDQVNLLKLQKATAFYALFPLIYEGSYVLL